MLHDPYFVQALKNTILLVAITVPTSTILSLLISVGLSKIKPLRNLYQTVYFLPYVTNTLAVGLVFMILFKKTAYSDGLINVLINAFGGKSVDFIDGPYWAKMLVMCIYTIWIVMPFKILILTSALASVNEQYYNAARVDGTSGTRIFFRITLPMIKPIVFYLVITGFIGAFKAYSDEVALFGTDLNAAGMNTIVGYVYDMLYGKSGGYPSYASAAAIILFLIEKIGPVFENDSIFPDRVNTEFVEVIDRDTLSMRVWERGSGETLACGTGACAVAVASILNGLCNDSVTVKLLGGDLKITWDREADVVYMEGPANIVFTGEWNR